MSIIHNAGDYQTDFKRGPHWNHESPFLPIGWDSTPPDRGARSLKLIARRRLLSDQSALSPELFKSIPWLIAKDLWEYLGTCEKQTLYLWKIMTTNYPEFHKVSPSYRLRPGACKLSLRQYFDVLNDEDCHWRAVLSVSTAYTDVSDLVAVSSMKNLVALEINNQLITGPSRAPPLDTSDKGCKLHDGILRSWMEMASAKGTLQHLRMLRIQLQADISPHILPMLRKLPQLQVILLYDCDQFTEAMTRSKDQAHSIRMGGWIAQRVEHDPTYFEEDQEPELKEKLLDAYTRFCGPDHYVVEGMQPPQPPSLHPDIPLMEFQLPRTVDFPEEMFFSEGKLWTMAKSVILLVKSLEGVTSEKKRSRPEESGSGKRRKHTMKERGIQDIATTLSKFF